MTNFHREGSLRLPASAALGLFLALPETATLILCFPLIPGSADPKADAHHLERPLLLPF